METNKTSTTWHWTHNGDSSRAYHSMNYWILFTPQKMKFCMKDFFCKYDQIRRKLRIWSHLLKKSLMENFIFCAVLLSLKHKIDCRTIFATKICSTISYRGRSRSAPTSMIERFFIIVNVFQPLTISQSAPSWMFRQS